MTPLTSEITRESDTVVNSNGTERNLIAGLAPSQEGGMVILRAKGCKTDFTVSLADLWKMVNAAPVFCKECDDNLKELIKE